MVYYYFFGLFLTLSSISVKVMEDLSMNFWEDTVEELWKIQVELNQ